MFFYQSRDTYGVLRAHFIYPFILQPYLSGVKKPYEKKKNNVETESLEMVEYAAARKKVERQKSEL